MVTLGQNQWSHYDTKMNHFSKLYEDFKEEKQRTKHKDLLSMRPSETAEVNGCEMGPTFGNTGHRVLSGV